MGELGPGKAFVLQGGCREIPLPDRCVQTVMTSPPYWGLRDYKLGKWIGGDPVCDHLRPPLGGTGRETLVGTTAAGNGTRLQQYRDVCAKCQAHRVDAGLGLEDTPEEYVTKLVGMFREIWRVLRDDGTVWLNLGDCYASSSTYNTTNSLYTAAGWKQDGTHRPNVQANKTVGLKAKDLVGIPWLVAFALRTDGWYLRSDIIWAKGLSFCATYAGSVMPESVVDRPTRGHEYLFLLTKREKYYWNPVASKEPGVYPQGTRAAKGSGTREGNRRSGLRKKDVDPDRSPSSSARTQAGGFQDRWDAMAADGYATYSGYRNLRDVWAIGTRPYTEAHFATFPEGLVTPCLQIGSAPWACAACHTPYKQVLDQEPVPPEIQAQFEAARTATTADTGRTDGHTQRKPNYVRKVTGDHWEPTCACETTDTEFQIVLDPFSGSGTVGVVAQKLGRYAVLLDLSLEYGQLARRRNGLAGLVEAEAQTPPEDLELEAAVGD